MSFKVQTLETKLSKLTGNDPEDGREKKIQIDNLQTNIEKLSRQLTTLNTQSIKLEENMKKLTALYNNETKNIEKIVSFLYFLQYKMI